MRTTALLLVLGLAAGCANQATLATDYAALKKELAAAQAARRCAVKDLALAEANAEFARMEFEQGDAGRGADHVAIARKHAAEAAACGAPPAPKPAAQPTPAPTPAPKQAVVVSGNGDSDRDGVPDRDDTCPMDPEDLDGFKDADGCPDLDDDNDGIPDSVDRCPRAAEDRDGFEDADGCADTDNDRDGFIDAQDQCPSEPGIPPNGCPKYDRDRDGFSDATDRCPNEAGVAPDGCPVYDRDRDGIADAQDQCPAEPGGPPTGCPVYDRDRDGIADASDRCPDQPETRDGYQDEDGCPDAKPQRVEVTSDQIVIHQRINFLTGKAKILPDSFPVLDDVAVAMKDYPQIRIEIGGHTDNVGDDAKNQRLSKDRADAVWEYLLAKGIAANRMTTMGYGETRPIDTNMTESGRLNNRRVEFLIQK